MKDRKTGEFIGVIQNTTNINKSVTADAKVESTGFVRKLKEQGKLAEMTQELVVELAELISESPGYTKDAFTTEEIGQIYEAERQLFYLISQSLEKQKPLEKIAKDNAKSRFERFKSSGAHGYLISKTKPVPVLLREYAAKH